MARENLLRKELALRFRSIFLQSVPVITVAILAIIVLSLLTPPHAAPERFIRPAVAHQQAVADMRMLIDIRTPEEWRQTGIPQGGVTADFNALSEQGVFVDHVLGMVGGDKTRPIALICARGGRSGRAVTMLEEAGFSDIRDVHEGMLGNRDGPGWIAGGLPTLRWHER